MVTYYSDRTEILSENLVTNLISVLSTLITLVQDVNSTKAQLKIASALVPFAVSCMNSNTFVNMKAKFVDEGGLNPVITLGRSEVSFILPFSSC